MILLFFWLSAMLLVVSGAVHVAALCGCDVVTAFPRLWILHLLLFAVFVPAIYYANKFGGDEKDEDDDEDKFFAAVPLWIKTLIVILFVYAMVSCTLAEMQTEGGGANQLKDGSFALTSHGRFFRELTEEEYHRYRSYEVRAASGVWMLFYSVSIMLLAGAMRMKQRIAAGEPVEPHDLKKVPSRARDGTPRPVFTPGDRPPSPFAALMALGGGIGLLWTIASGHPALNATAASICIVLGVFYCRRQLGVKEMTFGETAVGCFAVFPSFFVAIFMTFQLQWFVYVAITCGLEQAATGAVTFAHTETGPYTLTNGQVVNHRLLPIVSGVVWPPGLFLGGTGLIYLADVVGRYVAFRPWKRNAKRCPSCRMPLRTETAQQCSHCGADWHRGSNSP